MGYELDIDIIYEDENEDTVSVNIDLDTYCECGDTDEQISYIESEVKKQYENVKEVKVSESNLEEIEDCIKDINDPSDWTGGEDFDEFMEHEDFDDDLE